MTDVEERLKELFEAAAPHSDGLSYDAIARAVRRRRTTLWSVTGATVAVIAVICTAAVVAVRGGGSAAPSEHPAPALDLVALTKHVTCPPPQSTVSPAELAAFHAVTVVSCGQRVREFPGEGQWLVAERRVATGGVAALQAALAQPDEPRTQGVCTDDLIGVAPVVLVDAAGHAIAPKPPLDGCRKPQLQFRTALAAVTWKEVSVRKLKQVETPQAEASGCPQQFKNMTFVMAQLGERAGPGGPLFMRTPKTVRVCLYRVPGNDFEVGNFVQGGFATAAQTRRLLAAMSHAGVGGACAPQRDFAAVLTSGEWATVELGGCWRVARSYPSNTLGSADHSRMQFPVFH